MKRGLVILAVAAVVALVIARPWRDASGDRATTRAAVPRNALIAAVQGQHQGPHAIDETTVRGRGLFREVDGDALTVGQGETQDHKNTCVVAAGKDSTGIACDPAPFADAPVQLVETFTAGPGGNPYRKWQVTGLALPVVKRIELLDSAARHRSVELSAGGAFFFELTRADLVHGVTAVSLLVYGGDGSLMKEVPL